MAEHRRPDSSMPERLAPSRWRRHRIEGGRRARWGKRGVTGVLAIAALVLAACGGGSGSASSSSTSSASTSSSSTSSGELAHVKSTGKLAIAMSSFAPQDFQNKSGTWTGYDVTILKGFAKTLGVTLKITPMPFSSSVEAVHTHRDDVTIDIYYNKTRAKSIAFSRPMLNYNDVVAVNSTSPQVSQATLTALSGKSIAVTTGSAEVTEAKKVPNANITQYSNLNESLLALSSGRVAADFQPDTDISWAQKNNSSLHVKILGPVPSSIAPPIASLRGYYGVPKGTYSTGFLKKLNSYLKKIACNGTEQSILNKYNMKNSVYLKGICSAPTSYSGTTTG